MRLLLRCMHDYRRLWRVWVPLLLLSAVSPAFALAMPLIEKRLIDGVILPRQPALLPGMAALYAGLWVASMGVAIVGAGLRAYLGERLTLQLRQRLFAHCGALSLAFARREHSARTMALFFNDVPALTGLFSTTIIGGVGSLIALVVGGVVMIRLDPRLAIAAGVGPPAVAALAAVVTRPLRPAARRVQEQAAEFTERLQENLAGLREVVAFGQEAAQEARFASTMWTLLRLRLRVTLIDSAIQSGTSVVSLTVTLLILMYGAYLVIEGRTTLGTVVAMRSLFGLLFQPAGQVIGLFSATQKALGAAERVYAFLDETPAVADAPAARAPRAVAGAITCERVSFAYRPGQPVLRDISFAARPGETIALVGPSGAGKSTLVSLLARFYDPGAGRVLLDEVDLRALTLAGLRDQIGIVFQDTYLFAQTIRDNIAFGCATADEAAIVAAARSANAWEFIERLPAGLDTRVGERGVQLSEGQRQRLAIARALLRDPRILILDEPTSALDARSEHLLQAALANLMRGRTTFVIAHRLATVRRADQILVLDGGRIVEHGAHDDLMLRRGLYHELVALQFGEQAGPPAEAAEAPAAGRAAPAVIA
ncbi:MAG TPA: ABC transporter ATP-binding protein [Thermomicrobiales bacterium]|nr:ABC transporter ATP-binding protein [Thermomicrobiales bacterium]